MDYNKKQKIKEYFKKNWKALVGVGSFLLIAGIVMLIGFGMTGWSFTKWLQSRYATTFFIALVAGVIIMALLYIWLKNEKNIRR